MYFLSKTWLPRAWILKPTLDFLGSKIFFIKSLAIKILYLFSRSARQLKLFSNQTKDSGFEI